MIDKQIKLIPDGWRLYGVDMSIEGRAAVQLQGPSFGDSKCHDYISATEPTLGGAILTARLIAANTYRGWTISEGRWPEPAWHATGPNYDAWTEGEGEWCDNGEKADAPTRAALITEIDARIEELADAAPDLSALSIADVLEAAAALIEPEGAWCRLAGSRDAHGNPVGSSDPAAVCWCTITAISKVGGHGDAVASDARQAVREVIGSPYLALWNDEEDRTQAEVVAALKQAASLAREQSA